MVIDLKKLFEMQRELDEKIVREKGLHEMDRLPYLKLALMVELGELINEWRGFKFWSNDRTPRREKMLEEFVDCLHFVLSIGLLLGVPERYGMAIESEPRDPNTYQLDVNNFNGLFYLVATMQYGADWLTVVEEIICLGELLGFSWDEIEQAYIKKNEINHQRQATGY